jgi:uncharacterized protein (TIGR00369 family)
VRPDLCRADGGLRAGVLATLVDTAGGLVTGLAVLPDWVVTADLSVRMWGPVLRGPARAEARLLRRGRTTAIAEILLYDGDASAPCGAGVLTSGVLTPDFALPSDLGRPMVPTGPPEPPGGHPPLTEWLGVRTHPAGAELDVAPGLLNPWGMVHGGVSAMLVDAAVETATGQAVGDLFLRYLRPARAGPIRASVSELGPGAVRVVVSDEGADGRVVAHAVAELVSRERRRSSPAAAPSTPPA